MVWDRLLRYLFNLIDARMARVGFLGIQPVRVAAPNAAPFSSVDVTFEDSARFGPGIPGVPFAGDNLQCQPGARLFLEWQNGDSDKPRIVGYDQRVNGLVQRVFDPAGSGDLTKTVARSGDTASVSTDPQNVWLVWLTSVGSMTQVGTPPTVPLVSIDSTQAAMVVGDKPVL